jgi:hypothetical protein
MMPGVMLNDVQIAAITGKMWSPGRTLRVRFMDGDPRIADRCIPFAREWEKHANIKFSFGSDPNSELRISFKYRGSWSFVGTDCLAVDPAEATMNFGWLDHDAPNDEFARVVTHEFGHALALIHEHQNPTASIPWNKEAVYAYFQGAPNYWTKEQVDINLFTRYSADITRFSEFDPNSIMLYPIPSEFLLNPRFAVGWNRALSETDKRFIAILYPRVQKPTATIAVGGGRVPASIGEKGEVDTFEFTAEVPARYRIETFGALDTVISLYGPNNETTMVAKDDDSGRGASSRIAEELAPGVYAVRVRHFSPMRTGSYEISVTMERDASEPQRFG